jgi:hypothetical protein
VWDPRRVTRLQPSTPLHGLLQGQVHLTFHSRSSVKPIGVRCSTNFAVCVTGDQPGGMDGHHVLCAGRALLLGLDILRAADRGEYPMGSTIVVSTPWAPRSWRVVHGLRDRGEYPMGSTIVVSTPWAPGASACALAVCISQSCVRGL